jgi:Tfp pilus assembly protein PilO
METLIIVLIVIAVLAVLAFVLLRGRLGQRRAVQKREEAAELRGEAEMRASRAAEREALADEQAEQARRERQEAEERARRADRVDPDVDV